MSGKGIGDVWNMVEDFIKHTKSNGFFQANRNRQSKYWMYESINEALKSSFYGDEQIASLLPGFEEDVLADRVSSFVAAKRLLDTYFGK